MKLLKILAVVIIVIIASIVVIHYFNTGNSSNSPANNVTYTKTHYDNVYGNSSADVYKYTSTKPGKKFAFILGVHPYEWEAHKAFNDSINQFSSSPDFKGEIDVYWVHVPPQEGELYVEGRDTGEKSVGAFTVPLIIKEHYDAVFDIHSSMEGYPYKGGPKWYFLKANTTGSENLSKNLSEELSWAPTLEEKNFDQKYQGYDPYYGRVMNPIANSGIPTVLLEWGWCKPETLWQEQGIVNLNATDPGEYEDKLQKATMFLQKLETLN